MSYTLNMRLGNKKLKDSIISYLNENNGTGTLFLKNAKNHERLNMILKELNIMSSYDFFMNACTIEISNSTSIHENVLDQEYYNCYHK